MARTPNVATIYGRGYSYTERGPSSIDDGIMNDCMQAKGYSVSRK
jgi:hypothetical protein